VFDILNVEISFDFTYVNYVHIIFIKIVSQTKTGVSRSSKMLFMNRFLTVCKYQFN
jgi:hypothetical protein